MNYKKVIEEQIEYLQEKSKEQRDLNNTENSCLLAKTISELAEKAALIKAGNNNE